VQAAIDTFFLVAYCGRIKEMVMANRSKKTVLSVRVSGYAKSCLDVLAAIEQKSLPDAIEGLLEHAFDRKSIAPPAFIRQDKL